MTFIRTFIDMLNCHVNDFTSRRRNIRRWASEREKAARPGRWIDDDILYDILEFSTRCRRAAVASANRRVDALTRRQNARPLFNCDMHATTKLRIHADGRLVLKRPDGIFKYYYRNDTISMEALQKATFLRFTSVQILITPADDFVELQERLAKIKHLWSLRHVELVVYGYGEANAARIRLTIYGLFRAELFQRCTSIGYKSYLYNIPGTQTEKLEISHYIDFELEPLIPHWRIHTVLLFEQSIINRNLRTLMKWLQGERWYEYPHCLFLRSISASQFLLLVEQLETALFDVGDVGEPPNFILISPWKFREGVPDRPTLRNTRGGVLEWRRADVMLSPFENYSNCIAIVGRPENCQWRSDFIREPGLRITWR